MAGPCGIAAAVAEANGPEAGLAALDAIDLKAASGYQPYWAVRSHLLRRLGTLREASPSTERLGLTEDPAVRQFLLQKRA